MTLLSQCLEIYEKLLSIDWSKRHFLAFVFQFVSLTIILNVNQIDTAQASEGCAGATSDSHIKDLKNRLDQSEYIRFMVAGEFDGIARVNRPGGTAPGARQAFGSEVFRTGESYTVVIVNDFMYVGKGHLGPWKTFEKSHLVLFSDAKEDLKNEGIVANGNWKGGAIRVNLDGSIDVSGRHLGRLSRSSEHEIVSFLKSASPEIRIRSHPDRFKDLDREENSKARLHIK